MSESLGEPIQLDLPDARSRLSYIATKTARIKARSWFSNLALEETLAEGRAILGKELQRLGGTSSNMDDLAAKLGYAKSEDLYIAAARGEEI